MTIKFKFFNSWRELDNYTDARDFLCYQISTGQILGLDYEDIRRLFINNAKSRTIERAATFIQKLQEALDKHITEGTIEF